MGIYVDQPICRKTTDETLGLRCDHDRTQLIREGNLTETDDNPVQCTACNLIPDLDAHHCVQPTFQYLSLCVRLEVAADVFYAFCLTLQGLVINSI